MKRIILALLMSAMSLSVSAGNQSISPSVQLLSIKAVATAEKYGDELYMTVTSYPSKGKASHYQVPKFPLHWPSEHLGKIRNITLWNGNIDKGQAVELVMSLVEQDTPPWNTNDLIGTIKVKLHNKNGKLESSFSIPNMKQAGTVVKTKYGKATKFEFVGADYKYELVFMLKTK